MEPEQRLIDCLPDERGRRIRRFPHEDIDILGEKEEDGVFDTGHRCRACQGVVVEEVTRHNPYPPTLRTIGPGSRSQFEIKRIYYCTGSDCGISYHHVPGYDPRHRTRFNALTAEASQTKEQ